MSRIHKIAVACMIMLSGFATMEGQTGDRQTAAQKYIDIKMQEEPFKSGLVGVLAVTAKGDTIAEFNSSRKLIPASNTKLISTGLAIRGLGPSFRFSTKLGYSGYISNGTLHGDLYIIGGGDPTIASGDRMAMKTDSLFAKWTRALRVAGIRKIHGHVIGDGRFFDGPIENDTWSYNDLGTDYGTGGNGLSFNRNIQFFSVSPTTVEGKVNAEVTWPSTPWMEFRNCAVTARPGTGDNLYQFNTDLAPIAELRGSLAIDKGQKKESFSNKFGALTCAWEFAKYLENLGIHVTESPADIDPYDNIRYTEAWGKDSTRTGFRYGNMAESPENLTLIYETKSPSLKEIAKVTNSRSDNFYAETLIRMLAKKRTGSANYDSCKVVIIREMDSLGVDMSHGAQIKDGSGLSRHDYIAPEFFCRYLKAMSASPVFKQWLYTVGIAGEGTMAARLQGQSESLKHRIKMKSGSMNGVLCYSGYVMPSPGKPEDDMIIFSIMTNNCPEGGSKVRSFIDGLLMRIAK